MELVLKKGLKKDRLHLKVVINIKYTDTLIDAVNKYNDNLESFSQKILSMKIDFNDEDIEMKNLYGLTNKLSVVNSAKLRKETEQLLRDIITYGYILEVFRDTVKLL